jgi:hypothetical protein
VSFVTFSVFSARTADLYSVIVKAVNKTVVVVAIVVFRKKVVAIVVLGVCSASIASLYSGLKQR